MTTNIISKSPLNLRVAPNLGDYAQTYAGFSWEIAAQNLAQLPEGRGINIAHAAVDQHAQGSRAGHLALRWLGRAGAVQDFSYRDLAEQTSRFANVLATLGVQPGERVFVLAGRIPELYIAVLAACRT